MTHFATRRMSTLTAARGGLSLVTVVAGVMSLSDPAWAASALGAVLGAVFLAKISEDL